MNSSIRRAEVQSKGTQALLKNHFQGVLLDISPRVGKCKIVIDALKETSYLDIVISTPREVVKQVWEHEFKKWGLEYPVKVICSASLKNLKSADILIIDEVHLLSPRQIEEIKRIAPKRLSAVTGSLSAKTELVLAQELGLVTGYRYLLEEAISDGIISDYKINVLRCSLSTEQGSYVVQDSLGLDFLTSEQVEYNMLSTRFNRLRTLALNNSSYYKSKMNTARQRSTLLYKSLSKLDVAKELVDSLERCLVFTTLTQSADFLCKDTYHYKSIEEDKLSKFYSQEIDKLALVGMGSVGLTYPNLKTAVIHQLQSNEETAVQTVLRMCNFDQGKDAEVWITCYRDTVDEEWVNKGLSLFDKSKINYLNYEEWKEVKV